MDRGWLRSVRGTGITILFSLMLRGLAFADGPRSEPSIFAPASTPAANIFRLSLFVLSITGGIFVVVGGLLTYSIFRFRDRGNKEDDREPAQVYGSTQIELAWTVIPVLIVVVLFLTTARMIFAIQDAPKPPDALDVTVVGHQFWWDFRYPKLGIVTANELHVPLSSNSQPEPTYLKLLSADVDHSFWVPQPGGKDGPDSESRKRNLDRSPTSRPVCGAVCAILRDGARQNAAARLCRYFGPVRSMGTRPAAARCAGSG